MDYIFLIVLVGLAFYAGWHFRTVALLIKMSENPDHMIDILQQIKKLNEEQAQGKDIGKPLGENIVELELETQSNTVYLYDKNTGQFLAQGPNLMQAVSLAASRYPGKKFWHPELNQDNQTA